MTVLSFDEIVAQMRALGVPKERAEAAARRELGLAPDAPRGVEPGVLATDALEDEHVDEADKLVRALGGHVVRNSQKRASKITPGVPDRLYFFPRVAMMLFWEAKRESGKQSGAQKWFQELCDACSVHYVVGPLRALESWIVWASVARREADGSFTPLHR